ncbi:hypothetical protein AN220_25710 [Streptomyces nanshensis]|nr:hypothetical protein AN220_25710 [Streptomyces nanshensis]
MSIFPRIGTVSISNPRVRAQAWICAIRRGEPVPIRAVPDAAARRSASKPSPSRPTSTSRASARAGTAASANSAGWVVGRSFSECTAKSMSPRASASRSALTNTPVPPICASCSLLTSP